MLVVAWTCVLVCTLLVAVAPPLAVRIAICVCAATGAGFSLQSVFLHRGSNAIRALVWTDKGQMTALLESGQTGYPVTVRPGSFRLGRHGVEIGEPLTEFHGILAGAAHYAGPQALLADGDARMPGG